MLISPAISEIGKKYLSNFLRVFEIGPCYFKVQFKQWPLAGKFVEFEYSPKIRHFWRIRVLAKMVFLENWSDSLNSPTFANLFCSDSPDSLTFAKPFCEDLPDSRKASLVSLLQIQRIWRVWRVYREFSKFGEFGEFSKCRLDPFIHIKYVICA